MILSEDQKSDIAASRDATTPTRREVVAEVEAVLHEPIPVLENGFIRLVDYMGGDAAIVQGRACPTARAPRASRMIAG